MPIFKLLIVICWLVFISYWGFSALKSKKSVRRNRWPQFIFVILFIIIINIPGVREILVRYDVASTSPIVNTVGVILCALGTSFAIWARAYLGRNWGMPMAVQEDAELVTTGPYSYVRNPIYTGVILAMFGAGLVVGLWWIFPFLFCCIYFIYSAKMEEKIMMQQFPNTYPDYKKRTKMLIPFVF